MSDKDGLMRKIYLVACCLCYVAMQTFWLLNKQFVMFWMFIAIVACVLIAEVVNVKWGFGKTISTETTIKLKRGGKERIYGYLAILFMCLAIGFLGLHFGWI